MLWNYKKLIFLFYVVAITSKLSAEFRVKVLIAEVTPSETVNWVLESRSRLNFSQKVELGYCNTTPHLTKIEVNKGKIYLNGQIYKSTKLGIRAKETIIFNGQPYSGCFLIYRFKGNVLLINQVALENYICSVLKTESWPGWPKEVNKVFAVASRSYVLAQVLRSRRSKLPYHIRNTNHHQTYTGLHEQPEIKAAVEETRGIVLGYNNEPILAMFDCCCGGIIPAHMEGVDFENHPYLARDVACTHCKPFKIYSWQVSYSAQDFHNIIKQALPKLKSVKKITTKTDRAGTVKNLLVHSGREIHTIDARTMYGLFKGIKSFCYSICHKTDNIKFNGTGFGHHLGLCQWGAKKMVDKGHNYREILGFYYPQTKFIKFRG